VISRSLPSVSPAPRDARRRLPASGSRGPGFPTVCGTMLRSDCHQALLRSLRSSRASRYLACFRPFVVSPRGSCRGGSLHATPGPLVTRYPNPGRWQGGRWLSQGPEFPLWRPAPLLDPGGVLSTRRIRVQDCCLPATGNRRLSPRDVLEGYPAVHDYTHFGARSRGLPPRSRQLRTPITGCAREGRY
jgi:hypothetical protein